MDKHITPNISTTGNRRKHPPQKYRKEWETQEIFKEWLSPDPNGTNHRAYCRVCEKTVRAHRQHLASHGKSFYHHNKSLTATAARTIRKSSRRSSLTAQQKIALLKPAKQNTKFHPTSYKIKNSEKAKHLIPIRPLDTTNNNEIPDLKLAVFMAEHSSIKAMHHLTEFLPHLDSKLQFNRIKSFLLIKNILSVCLRRKLVEEIGESRLSLIINRSPDGNDNHTLCILLKYFSVQKKKIVTTFYKLIQISDCTDVEIFQAVKNELDSDGIKLENIVGIGCDKSSLMVEPKNFVLAMFKNLIPNLVITKCICHSLQFCAEKACAMLPKKLEYFVRETHNWFSYSPNRKGQNQDLYKVMIESYEEKKSSSSSGCWLACFQAISDILDRWDELLLLFNIAKIQDKCYSAEILYNIMTSGNSKVYLHFLRHVLKELNRLNIIFQSENNEEVTIFEDLLTIYKNILSVIVLPSQLDKVSDTDLPTFEFLKYLIHPACIYFGFDFSNESRRLPASEIDDIKVHCRDFYVELANQIKSRLPIDIHLLSQLSLLKPNIATSQSRPSIMPLASLILSHQRDVNEAEKEWMNLPYKLWSETEKCEEFWVEVYQCEDSTGENKQFKNVSNLALALLTLPVSNSTVKRAFSMFAAVKNKIRDKISFEVVDAIMNIKFSLLREEINCIQFQPTNDMISLCNESTPVEISKENLGMLEEIVKCM